MLTLRYNEPVFILMLRGRVGCLRQPTLPLSARDWKVRSTKVDPGDFKHELLNWLRSTMAVNVLTVLWFSYFTFWNMFAKELSMLLQTSCVMALLYFSVIISNKTLCWSLWEAPLRCLLWSGGHSIQTFVILLELCLYMLGLWNECVDSDVNSDTCDLATVWCKPLFWNS